MVILQNSGNRMLKVLVGIPTYNGYQRVDWLLQSISMRTDKDVNYKIIVCDDSGNKEHQEKTKLIINKWKSILPIEVIINHKNIGVPASWNRIVKYQNSEQIILINDDIIVAKDWLKNMAYFLDNNPKAGGACYNCPKISEDHVQQLLASPDAIVKPIPSAFDNMCNKDVKPRRMVVIGGCGCFFGFRRDKYDMVGGFDENYYAFCEETDFYTALVTRGYTTYMLCCPRSWHMVSRTFRTAKMNVEAIAAKSRQYYAKKWKGPKEIVQIRYLDKIPFQKVIWICNGKIYEEVITSEYGYYVR